MHVIKMSQLFGIQIFLMSFPIGEEGTEKYSTTRQNLEKHGVCEMLGLLSRRLIQLDVGLYAKVLSKFAHLVFLVTRLNWEDIKEAGKSRRRS